MSKAMARNMTLNVRVSGALGEFVAVNVGESGAYDNVSEYVRDLIRKDKDRAEQAAFARLQSELAVAFAAPDASYKALSADDLIARNRARRSA